MKITIDIDEETAGCIWANHTWSGKYPRNLPDILAALAITDATTYRREFPNAVEKAVADFRRSNQA